MIQKELGMRWAAPNATLNRQWVFVRRVCWTAYLLIFGCVGCFIKRYFFGCGCVAQQHHNDYNR